ncbi:hypothetical protein B5S32_g4102 [[Candida] boidinii]|nr:hypothetical protein B5S32_g4102 [[Candida] boidinii]
MSFRLSRNIRPKVVGSSYDSDVDDSHTDNNDTKNDPSFKKQSEDNTVSTDFITKGKSGNSLFKNRKPLTGTTGTKKNGKILLDLKDDEYEEDDINFTKNKSNKTATVIAKRNTFKITSKKLEDDKNIEPDLDFGDIKLKKKSINKKIDNNYAHSSDILVMTQKVDDMDIDKSSISDAERKDDYDLFLQQLKNIEKGKPIVHKSNINKQEEKHVSFKESPEKEETRDKMAEEKNPDYISIDIDSDDKDITKIDDESMVGDTEVERIEAPPVIPDSFQIEELKERRYRSQLENFEIEKKMDDEEDMEFNSRFRNSDSNKNGKKFLDTDNGEIEVELNERLSDGRLALSDNEKRIQKLLQKEEIEEALYATQVAERDAMEDDDDDFMEFGRNMDESDKDDLPEAEAGLVGGANTDITSFPGLFKLPPSLSKQMEEMRETLDSLTKVAERNNLRLKVVRQQEEKLKKDENRLLEDLKNLV